MEAADETHKDSCVIDIFEADGYEDVMECDRASQYVRLNIKTGCLFIRQPVTLMIAYSGAKQNAS